MSKRLKFFIGHLSISFLIALVVVGVVFFIWYPSPLAKAVGVTHIFLMLMIIDVIVGPILGWLVYKEGKKTLRIDLTIIILIQFFALSYGIYAIQQGRPVWLVFNVDQFDVVRNNEIYNKNVKQAEARFQGVSLLGPQFAAIKLSGNSEKKQQDMFDEIINGISLSQRPERYVELTQAKNQIQQRALPLVELQQYNSKADVEKTLAKYTKADAWLPLKANAVDMVVLVNKESASIIKIVDLRPWK
ncbi:TfpX/TfpZ family type IV pilin accessory protein [Acinetobacter towneri]|uniref:TfpX/TfpZ family type IV pilin accessory protein n=1 Tax=Acinetobacter towneri TaxID=202956 RepID=UPI00209AB506|nr:TfpX/TfpZ family type IV pilin accessory protein [Acinetobacter towneri]MCO8056585.1 type IV pilin accessory protein [Acinetobacter towneri]